MTRARDLADRTIASAALPKAGGAMTGTITNFTSTGIDDNASGAVAMTIDASENIGIGTAEPLVGDAMSGSHRTLTVGTTTGNQCGALELFGNTTTNGEPTGEIQFVNSSNGTSGTTNAVIKAQRATSTDDADLVFQTQKASGALADRLKIATSGGIRLTQDADDHALFIDSEATTKFGGAICCQDVRTTSGSTIYVSSENETGGKLTTGSLLSLYSNSDDGSARKLVQIWNDHTSADGAICLYIKDDGAETPISVSNGAHLTSGGAWTNASDRLKKKDITDISYGLAEVLQMQPRSFTWKTDDKDAIGFISQELD